MPTSASDIDLELGHDYGIWAQGDQVAGDTATAGWPTSRTAFRRRYP